MKTNPFCTALLLVGYLVCHAVSVKAQGPGQHKNKTVRKIQKTIWTAGISGIVIDDDARAFKNLFNVKETWNMLPFPTGINFEGYADKGMSVNGSFAYMRLYKTNPPGDQYFPKGQNVVLLTFDASLKYDLNHLFGNTRAFSPYAIGGLGYTHRGFAEYKNAITGNFGLGFTLWIDKGLGLNAQSMAKFALNNAASKNYLMHSLGLAYRFNMIRGYITPDRLGRRRR